jgi:hypothetical protein
MRLPVSAISLAASEKTASSTSKRKKPPDLKKVTHRTSSAREAVIHFSALFVFVRSK